MVYYSVVSKDLKINFVFFYIKKNQNNDSVTNVLYGQNENEINFFVSSIKKNYPNCNIIQCSDLDTPKIIEADTIFREKIDINKIMEGRIFSYSKLNLKDTSIFLDTDMLLVRKIPFELFIDKADIFLLKRSFNLDSRLPKLFRGEVYEDHLKGTIGNIYPFIGCFIITKTNRFWRDCYKIYKRLNNNYKFWFGDQKILREVVEKKLYNFAFLNESDFACPPQFILENKPPFLIHFKGKKNKSLIKKYYDHIYTTT